MRILFQINSFLWDERYQVTIQIHRSCGTASTLKRARK